jgi:hypothetical protein
MPMDRKMYRKKSTAKRARRKGESVVKYKKGYQLKRR